MKIKTLQYHADKGWSESFPELDSDKTIIIAFAAPEFANDISPLKELSNYYKKSTIVGCSTSGEIYGAKIYDVSISVAIIKFDSTNIKSVNYKLKSNDDSLAAGKHIANELNTNDLKSIFILSNGLNVNGSGLVEGINSIVKNTVKVTGGLAGDGSNFKKTWSFYNGELEENNVIAFGLYGDKIKIGHGTKGGWDIFGPERIITRSNGNVLYELDNKPALELYKQYLGELSDKLPSSGLLFPLAIRENRNDNNPTVRTILSVDEKEHSLTFAGDMPEGYYAQLMRANFDRLIFSAGETGELATQRMFEDKEHKDNDNILCIAISCVGRRLLLGERTEEELDSLKNSLPENTNIIGFYSYGELSPYATGPCQLHNQTMTITTIYEAE